MQKVNLHPFAFNLLEKGRIMLAERECHLLEQLWREHAGTMRSFMLARTGNTAEAEDAVGEVYWRACRALARGKHPRQNPKGWIWQILHHYRIDRARQHARRPQCVDWSPARLEVVDPPNPVMIEEQAQVRAALIKLPPRQARVLILRHYRGYRLDEIAALWNITYGATKAIHHRAMLRLRTELNLVSYPAPPSRSSFCRQIHTPGEPNE